MKKKKKPKVETISPIDIYTGKPMVYEEQSEESGEVIGNCPKCYESKLLSSKNGFCKRCSKQVTVDMETDRERLTDGDFTVKYGYGEDNYVPEPLDEKARYREKKSKSKKR